MVPIHAWIFFIQLVLVSGAHLENSNGTGNATHSDMVKKLFETYDGTIRPANPNGSSSTIVSIGLTIENLRDFDDEKMTFSVQLTIEMRWNDSRLRIGDGDECEYVNLPLSLAKKLWRPDMNFVNECGHLKHSGSRDDEHYRIYGDGVVLYRTRVTVTYFCPISLEMYPFDKNTCTMMFANAENLDDDVQFAWSPVDPLVLIDDLDQAGFWVNGFVARYCPEDSMRG
ncbi:Glutamate-gated chloride channel [Folsomia candida]|uniref:Glutamate-gated chloride channel n=2 Tax=Folsomia candida TaxID=158441 RepID=A0A226DA02_FOLCA|nr:Glutamate-gated chloride channel [Folsomia candida]